MLALHLILVAFIFATTFALPPSDYSPDLSLSNPNIRQVESLLYDNHDGHTNAAQDHTNAKAAHTTAKNEWQGVSNMFKEGNNERIYGPHWTQYAHDQTIRHANTERTLDMESGKHIGYAMHPYGSHWTEKDFTTAKANTDQSIKDATRSSEQASAILHEHQHILGMHQSLARALSHGVTASIGAQIRWRKVGKRGYPGEIPKEHDNEQAITYFKSRHNRHQSHPYKDGTTFEDLRQAHATVRSEVNAQQDSAQKAQKILDVHKGSWAPSHRQ